MSKGWRLLWGATRARTRQAVVVISHNPLLIDHLRPHAKRVHLE